MSWDSPYTHALAISADMVGSAVLWANKTADITISSIWGLELRRVMRGEKDVTRRLVVLGRVLNRSQANHCELGIAADLKRLETDTGAGTAIETPGEH